MPNRFAHIELNTDDLKRTRKFHGSLFKWKLAPNPGSPTAWLPYVEVDDVKKTIAKAKKLGATIVLDFQDIGDMGAIGVFVDPQGASLGVWAKPVKRKTSLR